MLWPSELGVPSNFTSPMPMKPTLVQRVPQWGSPCHLGLSQRSAFSSSNSVNSLSSFYICTTFETISKQHIHCGAVVPSKSPMSPPGPDESHQRGWWKEAVGFPSRLLCSAWGNHFADSLLYLQLWSFPSFESDKILPNSFKCSRAFFNFSNNCYQCLPNALDLSLLSLL